jgi:hypothetical protein
MSQLIVGNDLDGVGHVFGDTVKAHMDHTGLGHLWKSGPNPKPYWDFFRDWTKDDGTPWTGADFVKLCNEAADCGCLFNGPVRDGWLEMMYKQAEEGHYIVIITDRPFGSSPEVSQKITVEWLHEHDVYYDELIFSPDKTCRWTDLFIDDKIENYDALREAGTNAFLLNRPWNEVPGGDARQRIDTFDEFLEAIETTAKNGFYDQSFA